MYVKHGHTWKGGTSRLYRIWVQMRRRCRENHPGYEGVTVSPTWSDFDTFLSWAVANDYADDLQIDRIDPYGNYEPNNCRWVTPLVNGNNKRNSTKITAFGETKSISLWARDERCAVSRQALWSRLELCGWSPEKAITTPVARSLRTLRWLVL
jgi:hypothetical protein